MSEGSEKGRNIETSIGALGGEVTLSDLFPPAWVRANTDAETIGEFVRESDFEVGSAEDFYQLPELEWDDYVAAHAEFEDWSGMLAAALDSYLERSASVDREEAVASSALD